MADTSDHYNELLANYYSWTFGDFEAKVQSNQDYFLSKGIAPGPSQEAVDLGAGSGFQSIALARMKFKVTAIDFCQKLLDELSSKSNGQFIRIINDDLLNFTRHCNENIHLFTCMGDTLAHLPSSESIEILFKDAHRFLAKEGRMILTFRDYSQALVDTDRFIPVRSDENTVFTCFLEYEPERIKVYDIVHEKHQGQWQMRKSFYYKLRLSPSSVEMFMKKAGFNVKMGKTGGFIEAIGQKLC